MPRVESTATPLLATSPPSCRIAMLLQKNAAALARVNSRRGAADIVSGSWQAAAVPKATGRASDRLGCTPTCRAAPCDLLPRLLLPRTGDAGSRHVAQISRPAEDGARVGRDGVFVRFSPGRPPYHSSSCTLATCQRRGMFHQIRKRALSSLRPAAARTSNRAQRWRLCFHLNPRDAAHLATSPASHCRNYRRTSRYSCRSEFAGVRCL